MRLLTNIIKMILPILAIAVTAILVVSAQAAPLTPPTISGGLFAGSFEGTLTGDDRSSAPITLELSQSGNTVTGDIVIGRGLVVDGGVCGIAAVPAATETAAGKVTSRTPRHLDAATTLTVQGMKITIDLDGDLSRDGDTLAAKAKIDLPWLCGRDPIITGTLERTS
jgi:hypothetical protein